MFTMPLFFIIGRRTWNLWRHRKFSQITSLRSLLKHLDSHDPKAEEESMLHSGSDEEGGRFEQPSRNAPSGKLGLKATAKLSVQFCLLWVSISREVLISDQLANIS
jgi:solute carrier family 35 protein F5